jgi:iron-sulfur cluster repair protein YtfE (RIC family)
VQRTCQPVPAGDAVARRLHRSTPGDNEDDMKHDTQGRDALLLLQEDHRHVAELFDRAGRDPTVFEEIQAELRLHSRIEEELVYPAIRAAMPESERELIDQAVEDHADVKQMLTEIAALSSDTPEFDERFQDLRDSVEQHVEEEEDEMFARARAVLDAGALAELGERIESRKGELKGTLATA